MNWNINLRTKEKKLILNRDNECIQMNVIYFRFASLMGKILSEMAIDGKSQYDISGFSMNRKAIQDPNSTPDFHITHQPADANKSKL